MIYPTSVPYVIETGEVINTPLYADGTPKVGKETRQRLVFRFPQEVVDRIHSRTKSLRFRRFLTGSLFSGIDLGWLFLCFDTPVSYPIASIRTSAGLDMDEFGFYTFDDARLEEFQVGGAPPDVDVFAFSDMEVASRAFDEVGVPNILSELKMQRHDLSYVLFAGHELHAYYAKN